MGGVKNASSSFKLTLQTRHVIWRLIITRLRVLLLQEFSNFIELSYVSLTFSTHFFSMITSLPAQLTRKKNIPFPHKNSQTNQKTSDLFSCCRRLTRKSCTAWILGHILLELFNKLKHFYFILDALLVLP